MTRAATDLGSEGVHELDKIHKQPLAFLVCLDVGRKVHHAYV